jgi:uncharacterized membrane protein
MWRSIAGLIAQLLDKTICFDIAENRNKALREFKTLIKEPENFKHRLSEFQAESAIMDRFATEKNSRLIVAMTFVLIVMTFMLMVFTLILINK